MKGMNMKRIVTTEEYDDNGVLKKKTVEEFMESGKKVGYIPFPYYPSFPSYSPYTPTHIYYTTTTRPLTIY
jgi:hypothetical protein